MTATTHHPHCIEIAVMAIAENNEATKLTEPGRELAPATEETAVEWLNNGTKSCFYEGDGGCGDDTSALLRTEGASAPTLGFDYDKTECGASGDDCDSCCADCFRLLDGHCDECGTCWCDGAATGECEDTVEGGDDE